MPRLPSAETIERPIPSGQTSVVQAQNPDIVQQADAHIGASIAHIGDAIFKIGEQLTKSRRASELSDALSKATLEVGNIETALDRDPDYKTAPQRFNHVMSDLGNRYENAITDPVVKRAFRSRFNHYAVTKSLKVLADSAKKEQDAVHASLDESMQIYSYAAANASSDAERKLASSNFDIGIAAARNGNWITEVDALKRKHAFDKEVASGILRKLVREDPAEAVVQLMSRPPEGMSESETQTWINTAIKSSELQLAKKRAEDERAERVARKMQSDLEDKTAKELHAMPPEQLTTDLVLSKQNQLNLAQFSILLDKAAGKNIIVNRQAYASLRIQASLGQDVRKAARRAYEVDKSIGEPEYNTILNEVETHLKGDLLPAWYKFGNQQINMKSGSDALNPPVGSKERAADTLDRWRQWALAHPNATDSEARAEYTALADQASLIEKSNLIIAQPAPRFLAGGRENPDLAATWKRTKEALADGEIDQFTYDRESELIMKWWRIYRQQETTIKPTPLEKK